MTLKEMIERDEMERSILSSIIGQIAALRKRAGKRLFICVYKEGGIGDWMQQAAVAMAVRRRHPKAFIVLIGRDLGPDADGQPLVNNLLRHHPAVDHTISYPPVNWQRTVRAIYKRFDIFYQPHYVMRTYNWIDPAAQHRADLCLGPYLKYALEFPLSNHWLEDLGETQWQMLRTSSGLDVSEADLWVKSGKCPAAVAKRRFVTLHNMAGGSALIKCAAMSTMQDVAAAFWKKGILPVQVGAATDPPIAGCADHRGLTINATAAVVKRSMLHIDIEGGLVYLAKAVGTRSAVFFGPTPSSVFGFAGNITLTSFNCRPCWWHADRWGVNCRDRQPICRNIPTDGAKIAAALLERLDVKEGKINRQDAKKANRQDAKMSNRQDAKKVNRQDATGAKKKG